MDQEMAQWAQNLSPGLCNATAQGSVGELGFGVRSAGSQTSEMQGKKNVFTTRAPEGCCLTQALVSNHRYNSARKGNGDKWSTSTQPGEPGTFSIATQGVAISDRRVLHEVTGKKLSAPPTNTKTPSSWGSWICLQDKKT